MTTAAEIEAAFRALPPADRGPLLDRLCAAYDELHPPPLTPEQIALVNERAAMEDRGEGCSVPAEESLAGLSEAVRRVAGGEDPDAVLPELRRRRDAPRDPAGEPAGDAAADRARGRAETAGVA